MCCLAIAVAVLYQFTCGAGFEVDDTLVLIALTTIGAHIKIGGIVIRHITLEREGKLGRRCGEYGAAKGNVLLELLVEQSERNGGA